MLSDASARRVAVPVTVAPLRRQRDAHCRRRGVRDHGGERHRRRVAAGDLAVIGAREVAVQRVRSGSDIGKLISAIEAEVHDLVAGVEPEVDVIGLGEVALRRVADRRPLSR